MTSRRIRKADKERKQAHRSSRQELRDSHKASQELYQQTQKKVNRLYQDVPKERDRLLKESELRRRDEMDIATHRHKTKQAEANRFYVETLKKADSRELSAKQLKKFKLPASKERFYESKEKLNSLKATEKEIARKKRFLFQRSKGATSKSEVKQTFAFKKEKSPERIRAEKEFKAIRADLKQAKKSYAQKRYLGKRQRRFIRRIAEEAVQLGSLDDTLSSARDLRDTVRDTERYTRFTYQAGKTTVKTGVGTVKFGWKRGKNTVERFSNFRSGKGWSLNNPNRHLNRRMKQRIINIHKNIYRGFKNMMVGIRNFVQSVVSFFTNPIAWMGIGVALIFLFMLAVFVSLTDTSPVVQDEFDLTDAWVHVSQKDRKESTDKVDYWSNIDDMMVYMGYRYGDWTLKDKIEEGGFLQFPDTGEKALNKLWEALNSDIDELKTVEDLYRDTPPYQLTDDELSEYEDYIELAQENGWYDTSDELANPFYRADDKNYTNPIVITKRFGYTSTTDLYEGSVLRASAGQTLLAVMNGTIRIEDSDIIIYTDKEEFRYKDVADIRVSAGDTVRVGDFIAKVNSQANQEVYYRKLKEKTENGTIEVWKYVNVGFYFLHVEYSQTTSVMSDIDLSADLAERVNFIYHYIKKRYPKATDNAIASILANWYVESNITAKRAEGDYLSPPVGATASSWDDPNWLSMNGSTIYNGRYPNILHRGLGLGQWTDTADGAIRHTLLRNFADSKGKKWYDLELQLEFMFDGDSPYYREYMSKFVERLENTDTLTNDFLVYWEGNSGNKLAERQNSAKEMLSYLKNGLIQVADFTKLEGSGQPLDVPYTITQVFGVNANNGLYGSSGHTGIDLAAPEGSPIYAITDGKVIDVNMTAVAINGNYVIHTLPDGTYVYYGHMRDVPKVSIGQEIKQGQLIGYVGKTGLATGPHIHLEWKTTPNWLNTQRNPAGLLSDQELRVGMVIDPTTIKRK